nr:PilZ domain-containing protein [uncultured Roseateles sp.]
MNTERRHFVRIAFDAPAQLTTTQNRFEAKVLDLSFKGALLSLPPEAKVPVGAPCLLSVRLNDREESIAMAAEVAYVQGHHVGLLCRSIDIDSITHLRRLIEVNLGEPHLLERELKALISA